MILKKILAVACVLLLVCAFVCGCNGGNGDTTPTHTDPSGSQSNEPSSNPTESINNTPNDGKVEYVITVTDQDGNPISGVSVQFCVGSTCMLPVKTNASGVVSVRYEQDDYHITIKVPEGYTCDETEFDLLGETTATVVLTAVVQ